MILQIKQNNRNNVNKRKAIEDIVKDEKVRVTVDIDSKLYKGIKLLCATAQRKIKIREVMNEAIDEYLNKHLSK